MRPRSPVAQLTPPPTPYCLACECRLKQTSPEENGHREIAFSCVNPTCPQAGYCLTCLTQHRWLIEQDELLGPTSL